VTGRLVGSNPQPADLNAKAQARITSIRATQERRRCPHHKSAIRGIIVAMRELRGVMVPHVIDSTHPNLKQRALLFDAMHVIGLNNAMQHLDRVLARHAELGGESNWPERRAELEYLIERGFLIDEKSHEQPTEVSQQGFSEDEQEMALRRWLSLAVRSVASNLELKSMRAVPVYDSIDQFHFGNINQSTGNLRSADVLTVALEAFPVPGGDSSWADILDFKAAQQNNRWAFRRFLHDVVSERQTEAEIRDDIEWTINEYTKELDRFQLKRSVTFMETYIIPTVEALESFKPSSFLKGIVSIKKRKIELLEAEARAPGREVAYVFDARRRFGAGQS